MLCYNWTRYHCTPAFSVDLQQAKKWAESLHPSQHLLEDPVLAPYTACYESGICSTTRSSLLALCWWVLVSCAQKQGLGHRVSKPKCCCWGQTGARISPSTVNEQSGRQTCWEIKQCWVSLILIQSFINGSRHPGQSGIATWSVLMMDFTLGDLLPKPMGTRWMGKDKPAFVRGERRGFKQTQKPPEKQESTSFKENYSFSPNSWRKDNTMAISAEVTMKSQKKPYWVC